MTMASEIISKFKNEISNACSLVASEKIGKIEILAKKDGITIFVFEDNSKLCIDGSSIRVGSSLSAIDSLIEEIQKCEK